jgi:hypothetical protein
VKVPESPGLKRCGNAGHYPASMSHRETGHPGQDRLASEEAGIVAIDVRRLTFTTTSKDLSETADQGISAQTKH